MKTGDEITCVDPAFPGTTVRTRVDAVYSTGIFMCCCVPDDFRGMIPNHPANESITWIRGHHAEDSDAARGLIATYALAYPRAP